MAAPDPTDTEARIASFIDKFEPALAQLIRACRQSLRRAFPTAVEIVYDNYNFFVIGYSPSARPSDTVVSLAAAANGAGLSFYRGATLADPHGLLLGSGAQNRFIRLPSADVLESGPVIELVAAAVAQSKLPFAADGNGQAIVKSVSAKQRPRRKPGKTSSKGGA